LETRPFAELTLSPKVLAAVEAAGYTTATPIQSAAIPIAVAGRDVLGIAQTGTGKTAAFTLPMITRLEHGRARARMPRSLILAPTRELAAQVAQAFEKYGVNHKLDVALLIGGVSMDDQVRKLDRGVDVLIATPGRLLDHFQRGRIMLMGVEILVIDEADRMLDMGFIPDIERICKLLPPRRQTLFFSATMPPEITRLADQFLKDPVRVEVAKPATTAKTITQRFRFAPDGEDWAKREVLREMIRTENVKNAIIFCNRKRDVAILLKSLLKHGFNAGALHGDMDQSARMATLDKFRSGELTLLAASDVAARGLDIPDVSHVFNFDLPWQPDDYVHRIGRTGRAGKLGTSLSIVTVDDLKLFKDIERMLGQPAQWLGEPPTEEDYADAGKRRRGRFGRGSRAGFAAGGRGAGGRGEHRGRDRGLGREAAPERGRESEGRRGEAHPVRERHAERTSARPSQDGRGREAQERRALSRTGRAPAPGTGREPRPGEVREARAPREERAPRIDRPAREEHPPSEQARAQPHQGKPQRQRHAEPRQGEAPAGGFADNNVPAFLRRPPRTVRAANE